MKHIGFTFFLGILLLSGNISGRASGNRIDGAVADTGNYDVRFYHLDLNISDTSTFILGSVSVIMDVTEPGLREVILDLSDVLQTDSVWVDNIPANYSHLNNRLYITIPETDPGGRRTLEIFYHGLGKNAGEVPGVYNRYNATWDQWVTWTLSEPFSALNWFPCKQSLTDKADSVYVFLSTDQDQKAGSNGLLTASVPLPEGRIRYEWKSRYPIDYYLISFAVSNYREYSFYAGTDDSSDSILIQNYLYNNEAFLAQNKSSIDKTSELIRLYSGLFGEYPFRDEKYGHCIAPGGGGMEHQTMTTLVNFSYLLVAHELAHQWFGDYVTCSTWNDIWINEGFASYAEYLANQNLVSQNEADTWMTRTHDLVKSKSGGSVYVPESSITDEDRIFDYRLTYAKGAAIIHMIRQEVGNDNLFFGILQEFLSRFKNGNASGEDFKNLLNEMTGKDFTDFFNQWYYGEGFPIQSISWSHANDTLYIQSLQTTSDVTDLFNVLIEYEITVDGSDTVISRRQTSSFDTWKIFLPGNVSSLRADPKHWLIIDIAGINQIAEIDSQSRFTLVPNPASDKVSLYMKEPVDRYTVYLVDSSGRILLSEQSNKDYMVIKVEKYSKGMYFIIVEEGNTLTLLSL